MSLVATKGAYISYAEYLRIERERDEKLEWLDGEIFAMAGGTIDHSGLSAQVAHLLASALEGRPYRVFNSDLKVRVSCRRGWPPIRTSPWCATPWSATLRTSMPS